MNQSSPRPASSSVQIDSWVCGALSRKPKIDPFENLATICEILSPLIGFGLIQRIDYRPTIGPGKQNIMTATITATSRSRKRSLVREDIWFYFLTHILRGRLGE